MKISRGAAGLWGLAMLLCMASVAIAQSQPEVRRARPVDELSVPRAIPIEPADRSTRSLIDEFSEPPARETEGADQRQLEYANGLFARKLYDLAIPEYQKYLDNYPGRASRANAYFSLGECYRNLNRVSNARTNFQKVLNDYGDSEFAGPAAYALAETFEWKRGLDLKLLEAREFYAMIALATLGGVALDFSPIDPIKALFWSAVINGVIAVPIMMVMMLLADDPKVMGRFTVTRRLKALGWLATGAMAAAVAGMLATW